MSAYSLRNKSVLLIVSDPYSSNPDPDPAKNLNPDPDPSYFFTLPEKNLNYVIIKSFYHQKKSIKR